MSASCCGALYRNQSCGRPLLEYDTASLLAAAARDGDLTPETRKEAEQLKEASGFFKGSGFLSVVAVSPQPDLISVRVRGPAPALLLLLATTSVDSYVELQKMLEVKDDKAK